MAGYILFATKDAAFWKKDTDFADIPVDCFSVYSFPNLITTNHLNRCSYLPRLSTVSILANQLSLTIAWLQQVELFLYIFSLSCVATLGTSKQIQELIPPIALHTTFVFFMRRVLAGKTEGFVVILATSGTVRTVRACLKLCLASLINLLEKVL